jgi:hypothetical protein
VTCPHCQEHRVPDDLELCWKCGQPMRQGDPVECPQCFAWSGYEDEYPCPQCGYDLTPGPGAIAPADSPMLPIQEPHASAGGNGRDRTSVKPEPAAPPAVVLVQCAICETEVAPAEKCRACGNILEAR